MWVGSVYRGSGFRVLGLQIRWLGGAWVEAGGLFGQPNPMVDLHGCGRLLCKAFELWTEQVNPETFTVTHKHMYHEQSSIFA